MSFKHLSLFSGIGGFDLASEWMGWENIAHCEINEFCQKILKYYWPNAATHTDIKSTDFTIYRGLVDIVTGGFPCQPYSVAGKQKGTEDERHLWPEMLRAIREIQLRYVVGENVPGLVNWSNGLVFNQVQADLEIEGYEVTPIILPAASIEAPHERSRIWFIAYSYDNGCKRNKAIEKINNKQFGERMAKGHVPNSLYDSRIIANANGPGLQKRIQAKQRSLSEEKITYQGRKSSRVSAKITGWDKFPTQSPICVRNDGLSPQLDGITFSDWRTESIKGGGNAIVPKLVVEIFKSIESYERLSQTVRSA